MKITQLYPWAEAGFVFMELYGKFYIVNRQNAKEREEVLEQVENHQIYKQSEDFLFLYENALFRIAGIKACYSLNNLYQNFELLLSVDDDDFVHFHSFFLDECVKELKWKELEKFEMSNFEYFQYFYKSDFWEKKEDRNKRFLAPRVLEDTPAFSILKVLRNSLKRTEKGFYLAAYGDAEEAFRNSEREKTTTFIRLEKESLIAYSIVGSSFKVSKTYDWISTTAIWKNSKTWILNGNKLFNIKTFCEYDLPNFKAEYNLEHIISWHIARHEESQNESIFFFTKEHNFSKLLKEGILWFAEKNILIPVTSVEGNSLNLQMNSYFWHWNQDGIPHVTIERSGEEEIYKIWYREKESYEIQNFSCTERPIAFLDNWGNQIYFFKTQERSYMLIVNRVLEKIACYTDVTFFEEISRSQIYTKNVERKIMEKGRFFTSKNRKDYFLEMGSILILKKKMKNGEEKFCIFWNDEKYEIDDTIPFIGYYFIGERNSKYGAWKIQKINIITSENSTEQEQQYIAIYNKEITTLTEEIQRKLNN